MFKVNDFLEKEYGRDKAEIHALKQLAGVFFEKMGQRLSEKQKEGFTGWDEIDVSKSDLPDRILHKIERVIQANGPKSDLVDIANFAMFLWNVMED
jgi:hypothetical protein